MNFSDLKKRIEEKGITYNEYISNTIEEISKTQITDLPPGEVRRFNYKNLNLQRSTRIIRTYHPSKELKRVLDEITGMQLWMVITENWCGDSGQNLPYIAVMALQNPLIDLKLLLRDSNPDVMDQFLTNGTRSIPILVSFNSRGEELFRWGPRPRAAINLISQWKSEGCEKPEWTEKLHLWYSRNRGEEIEKELADLINKVELTYLE